MKTKDEYMLQNIAGKWVVIDTNSNSVNFNKIISLNDSGKILWDKLEEGAKAEELVAALVKNFAIDEEKAKNDAEKFVSELKKLGCIEDEK